MAAGGGGSTSVTATFDAYASTTTGSDAVRGRFGRRARQLEHGERGEASLLGYPIWKADVSVPASTSIEYKYMKKDSSGNVTWESNANRSTTGTSAVEVDNSWNAADADATDVTFGVDATTDYGTNVYVVGSIPSLGS